MKSDNCETKQAYPVGYMRVKACSQYTGIPISSFWRFVQKGIMPPPIKISPRVTLWRKKDIDEAIDKMADGGGLS